MGNHITGVSLGNTTFFYFDSSTVLGAIVDARHATHL